MKGNKRSSQLKELQNGRNTMNLGNKSQVSAEVTCKQTGTQTEEFDYLFSQPKQNDKPFDECKFSHNENKVRCR